MGVEGTEKFYAVYGLDLVIPKYFSNIVDAVEYCTKQGGDMLTPHTRAIGIGKPVYQAIVRCTDSKGSFLWQNTLNIARANKEDALQDAIKEIEYIESSQVKIK